MTRSERHYDEPDLSIRHDDDEDAAAHGNCRACDTYERRAAATEAFKARVNALRPGSFR